MNTYRKYIISHFILNFFCSYAFDRKLLAGVGFESWKCAKAKKLKCPGRIHLQKVGENDDAKYYYVESSLVKHVGKEHDSDLDSDIIDIHRINVSRVSNLLFI